MNNTEIDFIDAFSDQCLTKVIASNCDSLANSLGCKTHHLHMKRENLAESAFWRAKKCYAMTVLDSEGLRYKSPHLKTTGLESVKSSTPKIVSDWLVNGYEMILNNAKESDILDFITLKYDEYCSLSIIDIAIPVKADAKMFLDNADISGKGPHIRGGYLFNSLLKKHKLPDPPVLGGKIKYILLKTPNVHNSDSLSFNTHIPSQFNIERFIDKKQMFEKSFLTPLASCCTITGYNVSNSINQIKSASSLAAFF